MVRNITEYYEIGKVNFLPARLPQALIKAIDTLNQKVISEFKIKQGMTHLELFSTKEGLIFGEIAIRPPGGYIMELLSLSYGFNAWEAFLKMELNIPCQFPTKNQQYSAAWIIHPGAGKIAQVENWDLIKKLPEIKKASLHLKAGTITKARKGLGESYGKVIFTAGSRDELIDTLAKIKALLKIQFEHPKAL
jgi:hypothetical protein